MLSGLPTVKTATITGLQKCHKYLVKMVACNQHWHPHGACREDEVYTKSILFRQAFQESGVYQPCPVHIPPISQTYHYQALPQAWHLPQYGQYNKQQKHLMYSMLPEELKLLIAEELNHKGLASLQVALKGFAGAGVRESLQSGFLAVTCPTCWDCTLADARQKAKAQYRPQTPEQHIPLLCCKTGFT